VLHVNREKAYAFVRGTDGVKYFTQVKYFPEESEFFALQTGERVAFEPFMEPAARGNGMRAKDVKRVA
jgi:hypothetical protein